MPTVIQDFILNDPGGGGANEKQKGDLVKDNQATPPNSGTFPTINCHTDTNGSIVKRGGTTVYSGPLTIAGSPSTTMEEITGLFQFKKFGGGEFEIASASSGGAIGIFDISTPGSPVEIQGSASITDDTELNFAVVNDSLLIATEDRDGLFQWDGTGNITTTTGSPSPPSGKYVAEFENYAFIANTTANPERVFFSALANPDSWIATDFIRLNGAVTGLGKSGNNLFAFTINSATLIRFTGDALVPFSAEQLETNVGCVSHRSIVNVEGILYWMSNENHIYRMQGFQPKRVTDAIPVTLGRINTAVLSKCVASNHVELRQVWFAVAIDGATENDFVIAFDYFIEEIFLYNGMQVTALANFSDSSGAVKTYFGDRNGRVYLTNTTNSDNPIGVETAIKMVRYSKQFHFGLPHKKKRVRDLEAVVNNQGSGITTISIEGDFGSSSGETLTITHDAGDTTIGLFCIGVDKLGGIDDLSSDDDTCTTAKFFQLMYENTQTGIPIEIRTVAMRYQVYESPSR